MDNLEIVKKNIVNLLNIDEEFQDACRNCQHWSQHAYYCQQTPTERIDKVDCIKVEKILTAVQPIIKK